MDEYKKMFESVERDFGNGSGEIPLIKLYNIMTTMPEFDKCEVKQFLKALSVFIKIDTKHSLENSFESVEDWLIKINFEKFLELIEKSLTLQYFRFSYSFNSIHILECLGYLEIEKRMILVDKLFPFIAKDGKSVSMAEFDQFLNKAQTIYQEILQNMEEIKQHPDFPQDFPPYEKKDINELFQSLDLDKDGKLSLEEMMIGLTNEPFSKFSMKYVSGRRETEDSD